MVGRLGLVIYWAGCVVAALAVGVALYAAFVGGTKALLGIVIFTVIAVFAFAAGRAALFILAGR